MLNITKTKIQLHSYKMKQKKKITVKGETGDKTNPKELKKRTIKTRNLENLQF